MQILTFKRALSVLVLLSFGTSSAYAANTLRLTVNGMVCAFCAQGIEKRLGKLSATQAVLVDLKNRTVAVEARDGQSLDTKLITSEIVDAGYDVVRVETVTQSVADIRRSLGGAGK